MAKERKKENPNEWKDGCHCWGVATDGGSGLRLNDGFDLKHNWWVDAWCLAVAGPTVAELEAFFSSDYLRVVSPFLCFIIMR